MDPCLYLERFLDLSLLLLFLVVLSLGDAKIFFRFKNQSCSNYNYDCDSGSVERPPLETIVKYFSFFYDSYIT